MKAANPHLQAVEKMRMLDLLTRESRITVQTHQQGGKIGGKKVGLGAIPRKRRGNENMVAADLRIDTVMVTKKLHLPKIGIMIATTCRQSILDPIVPESTKREETKIDGAAIEKRRRRNHRAATKVTRVAAIPPFLKTGTKNENVTSATTVLPAVILKIERKERNTKGTGRRESLHQKRMRVIACQLLGNMVY